MKILFITQWFEPEPGALRGLPLAKELVARGHEVQVLTGFPNYPGGKIYPGYKLSLWQREEVEGIPVLRVPLYPSHDASSVRRVLNYTSFACCASLIGLPLVDRPDVIYVYHPPPTTALPALILKAISGAPIVYHIADMWPESVTESGMVKSSRTKRLVEAAIHRWCNFVYRRAEAITVISPGFKQLLVERGVSEEKINVIYNWTDEETFQPAIKDDALAREMDVDRRFTLMYAGNFGPCQGLDTVVRAAARVRDCSNLQVVMVGGGQKEEELKRLANELGADNVRFLGRRDYREMPKLYALADGLIVHLQALPIFASTIPSKTQVSLSCGRPIVMAVEGDAASIVDESGSGLVCPPEDPEAMAKCFLELEAKSLAERSEMGEKGRAYYCNNFSLQQGANSMDALLRKVAA